MIAIARFAIPASEAAQFLVSADLALAALSACPGYLMGQAGQNTDDPNLWTLVTLWENVGSYRRALGNYQVKLESIPLLARAIDEPGAYVR